jgi:DNA-binding MarR family transcriptional regulator
MPSTLGAGPFSHFVQMKKTRSAQRLEEARLVELYSRPGFMIRRAHQIAIDLFIEACAPVDITPSQYGVLYIVNVVGPISQIGISRLIGLDRSTTALVVRLLTERGLLTKRQSTEDARKAEILITDEGLRTFRQAARLANKELGTLLSPFTEEESEVFLTLLERFVTHHNGDTRVSIERSTA